MDSPDWNARTEALIRRLRDLRGRLHNLHDRSVGLRHSGLTPDLRDRQRDPRCDFLSLEQVVNHFLDCVDDSDFSRGDEVVSVLFPCSPTGRLPGLPMLRCYLHKLAEVVGETDFSTGEWEVVLRRQQATERIRP